MQHFERIVAEADGLALERTAMIVLHRDVDGELRELAARTKVPVLILHGDSDSGMPLEASAQLIKDVIPWAELKIYEKAGHGRFLRPPLVSAVSCSSLGQLRVHRLSITRAS